MYTNADEHVVNGRRPVLLNGINDVAVAADLAERCLFVEFVRPKEAMRQTEVELASVFESERASILGVLLDRVSLALRDRDSMPCPGALPRMADFASWVYAGTPEEERVDMWRVRTQNRKANNLATVEEDALASALRTLAELSGFEGSAKEMLAQLNERAGISGPKDRPEGWPTTPDTLGKRLKRLNPLLGAVGVIVAHHRTS